MEMEWLTGRACCDLSLHVHVNLPLNAPCEITFTGRCRTSRLTLRPREVFADRSPGGGRCTYRGKVPTNFGEQLNVIP